MKLPQANLSFKIRTGKDLKFKVPDLKMPASRKVQKKTKEYFRNTNSANKIQPANKMAPKLAKNCKSNQSLQRAYIPKRPQSTQNRTANQSQLKVDSDYFSCFKPSTKQFNTSLSTRNSQTRQNLLQRSRSSRDSLKSNS